MDCVHGSLAMAERIQWRDVADAVAPAHGCVLVVRRDAIQTCGLLMRLAHQLGREGVPVVAVAGTVESGDTWERDGNVTVVKLAGAFIPCPSRAG